VLHVIEDLGFGGAENLLVTLLPELAARGFACEVAALGAREDMAAPLRAAGLRVHQARLASLKHAPRALVWLADVMRAGAYDLVHTHLTLANVYGRLAARAARVPATTTFHNTDYEPEVMVDTAVRPWKLAPYRLAERLTAVRGRPVLAVSEFVAASVHRRLGYARAAIEVIYNGVAPSLWEEVSDEARAAARRALGLPPDAQVVVQVGRLTAQKGQMHTVESARRLRDRRRVRWILVGEGPLRPELEAAIARADLGASVSLAGGRADVRTFLAAADLFVFPSRHEGLGIAVLEAMAAGLPVVAYAAGPLPEIVTGGATGALVPAGDVEALAGAVEALLADPVRARAMGRRGREEVIRRFSIATAADRHAAFYARVLAPEQRRA
jgi:glycosyltransferase involved in cell wall biosynthesis